MIITVVVLFSATLPLHTFAQEALVDDYFEQIEAYNKYIEEEPEPTIINPLVFATYVPQKEEKVPANDSDLVVDKEEGKRLAMANSATQTSGEYAEVVRYNNDNPQYYQASVTGARSSNIINSGALLVIFMLIIIVMIVIRMRKKKKQIYARRQEVYQDGFHDMSRYRPQYHYQPGR